MILITGGAGYIGSQVNKFLSFKGLSTVVFDNLSTGNLNSVKWGSFVQGDLQNIQQLRLVFNKYNITSVMHFAAYSYVGESVLEPEKYYYNNVVSTLNLLKVMNEFNVSKIIFSSTCATYGNAIELPITENHPQNPINPYGQSKLVIEKILSDYAIAYKLKYVILRYFNAAGADIDLLIGENHNPETHLIPLVFDVAIGKLESIKIFGDDYDTDDGTAIRDYIHVADIADAHVLALNYLESDGESDVFNLGNGDGYSVKEVIDMSIKITNENIKTIIVDRRAGDQARLIGSSLKAKKVLGWNPQFYKLEDIIKSAWSWHKSINQLESKI
jgi:UDP-glucose 4-epimerase